MKTRVYIERKALFCRNVIQILLTIYDSRFFHSNLSTQCCYFYLSKRLNKLFITKFGKHDWSKSKLVSAVEFKTKRSKQKEEGTFAILAIFLFKQDNLNLDVTLM